MAAFLKPQAHSMQLLNSSSSVQRVSVRMCTIKPNFCGSIAQHASVTVPSTRLPRPRASRVRVALAEDNLTADDSFQSLLEEEYEEEHEVMEVDAMQEVDESLKVENLGLCAETIKALKDRGIVALFPIQKSVFEPIAGGRDIIGRAKTGSGKTLAFALPVIESLLEENKTVRPGRGRGPRCLILAPTRELANQVAREFESACPSLVVKSFYGGVPVGPQRRDLERGIDVAVGTPGRCIDLIEQRALRLDNIRFTILDEADQMLDMGFEVDMETILGQCPPQRQTLLFSATLPGWVNKAAKRFQQNPLLVDLVGERNTGKLSDTIRLLVLQVDHSKKIQALVDILSTYGAGGKAIVFSNTKANADEIAGAINAQHTCEALHGDIAQAQREKSLGRFREGYFSVLVATDVAARGLDIPNVDLVVHFDPPQDNEALLHRSGRTGRAGNKGTAILMFTEREARAVGRMLKETKVDNAEMIGAPEPAEVMTSASRTVLSRLDKVDPEVVGFFVPVAERLLASSSQPARLMAAALASMSGFSRVPQPRSLLTYQEGYVTLRLMARPGIVDGFQSLCKALAKLAAKAELRELEAPERVLGKIKVVEDKESGMEGAAFDLPLAQAARLMMAVPLATKLGMSLDRPRSLALDVNELLMGGRRSPPRADRDKRSWDGAGRSRDYGSRDAYASRGASRPSFGSRDYGRSDGYGDRGYSRGGDAGYGAGRRESFGSKGGDSGFAGRRESFGSRDASSSRGGWSGYGSDAGGEGRRAARQ